MGEIFKSSEPDEKRAILNFIFQNPTLDGRTLSRTLKKPFNLVLSLAQPEIGNAALTPSCTIWQGLVDKFRTVDWRQFNIDLSLTPILARSF
jgi:hypothetical protein